MKIKMIVLALSLMLILTAAAAVSCLGASSKTTTTTTTTDNSGYSYTTDDGRTISFSGTGKYTPGQQSQYMLNIINNDQPWQNGYSVELSANGAVIQEVSSGQLNMQSKAGETMPVIFTVPSGVDGPLLLTFVDAKRGVMMGVALYSSVQLSINSTVVPTITTAK